MRLLAACNNLFLRGVGLEPDKTYAATIPLQTFMVYQLMFAIINAGADSQGAFAERMKFSGMLAFLVLWAILVYQPNGAHGVGQARSVECLAGRPPFFRAWILPVGRLFT